MNESDRELMPIEAAGGYVLRLEGGRIEVLMILRRGVWDLPKGKIDPGESPAECAVREVAEETGAKNLVIVRGAGMTLHRYVDQEFSILKTTWWFAMTTTSSEFEPEIREQIERVEWVDWDRAREIVGYENLSRHMEMLNEAIGDLRDELLTVSGS